MSSAPRSEPLGTGDPRSIVLWARRYAKSRTISFLVQWVFIMLMVSVVAISAALTNMAHATGNMVLFWGSISLMVTAILVLAWFSFSPWGGEAIWRITQWLYGKEGYVAYAGETDSSSLPGWLTALGGGLVAYHLAGALAVSFNYRFIDYLQPYSAVYMAPFLCVLIVYQRLGLWAWIWPLLYAAHAGLLLWGAPIKFSGQWQMMNLIFPVFGYGLIAILTGHAYSRYALWRLKRAARCGLAEEGRGDPATGDDAS